MPVLSNPRHEKFCQEMAKGRSQGDAYQTAGYDAEGHSAFTAGNRLLKNEEIRQRIVELQNAGAERAEVTVASLLDEAEEARALAMELGQPSAAVAAIREKGVLSGRRIERSEHGQPGDFENMNADQLRDWIAAEAAALSRGNTAAQVPGGAGAAGRKPH